MINETKDNNSPLIKKHGQSAGTSSVNDWKGHFTNHDFTRPKMAAASSRLPCLH